MNTRYKTISGLLLIVAVMLAATLMSCNNIGFKDYSGEAVDSTIKIGIIYSDTGDRAISEKSTRDAAAMAVEEINNDGGLLGKQVELLAFDSESKDDLYKGSIVQLLNKYHIKALFSNIPEGLRNYAKMRSKKSEALMFDLSDYVNRSEAVNIIRIGSSPQQLLYPGVDYLLSSKTNKFTNFFLIGTPDAYSINANKVLKAYLLSKGIKAQNIKEGRMETEGDDASDLIMQIKELTTKGRTCILNTMRGKANVTYFKEFANQGLSTIACPIMSFTISEDEMRFMGAEFNIGHIFCRNYFQSLDTDKNIRFVSDFKLFSAINELPGGIDRVTGEAIARTYTGIYLWKKAVEKAGSYQKAKVLSSLPQVRFNSPADMVEIDSSTLSLSKPVAIAESNIDGQMTVLWQSAGRVRAFK